VLIPLVLAFALVSPDIDSPPKYKAWVENHEVWMETSAGPRRVVYDALAADPVAASPSGDRIVYGVINPDFDAPHCGNTPQKFVALVNASGQFQWKAALKEACNDFDKFEWIDDHRIGVMLCGHANCFYWVLAAANGAILEEDSGGFDFVWSHNRRYVAHRTVGNFELDANNMVETSMLWFNDARDSVYPPVKPGTNTLYLREIIDDMTWSPDDAWLAFPEVEYPSYDSFVVLVSPSGKVLRDSLPVEVNDAVIQWTAHNHFQINASGRTFKYVVAGGALHEIVQR
jgi:hypothetical protein